MKRYIYEKFDEIKMTDVLDKQHLIDVKDRMSEFLIDTQEGKYFDAEENEWKEILEGS